MSKLPTSGTRALLAGAVVLLAAAGAGCGSGNSSSGGGASATRQITQDWTTFFSAKTPATKRIALLQDGSAFASIIDSQSNSTLAKEASAKVVSVKKTSSTHAAVTYDVLLAGATALKNQKGTAVLQSGTWKVGTASFCSLLRLQGGQLPSACGSAGG